MTRDLGVEPAFEARPESGAAVRRQAIQRARGSQSGLDQRPPGGKAGENLIVPRHGEPALLVDRQRECVVVSLDQRRGAAVELLAAPALARREEEALVGEARGRIDPEIEAGEMADRLGTDADLPV